MPLATLRFRTAASALQLFFAVGTLIFGVSHVDAQLPEDRSDSAFVRLLEEQQLFNVIAWDNEAKFRDTRLSEARRSTAAAQWLRAETMAALNQPQEQQESAWAQVESLSQTLVAETRLFPRHFLVRFQASVTGLARARLIRLQLKSTPDQRLRQQGREAVRTSIMQLGLLQRELIDAAAGANPRAVDDLDVEFSRPQFQALGNDVDFQILACLDVQASIYPANDEASRIDNWRRIIELAATLQPKLPDESKLWWQTQTIVLRAARQLEDWPEWQARWETAVLRFAPPEVLGDIAAAQLMHDLDRKPANQTEPNQQAAQLLQAAKNANNFIGLIKLRTPESLNQLASLTDLSKATAWPTFDIARARLFLLQSQMEAGDQANQQAEATVLKFAGTVAQRHGRFWAAQLTSELLAGGTSAKTGSPVSLLLVRERIESKQWEQVEQLIRDGIESAASQQQAKQALELAEMAAGVSRSIGPQPWMVEAIENATLEFDANPKAEGTHFFACVLASLLPENKFDDREKVWQRHLQHWPTSSNSDRIRLQLLAPFFIKSDQLDQAAESVDAVALDSNFRVDATRMLTAIFSDRYQQLFNQEPTLAREFARQWSDRWKPSLQKQSDWLNRWTPALQSLALLWVQAECETATPDYVEADHLLQRLKERPPELTAQHSSRWSVLLAKLSFQRNPATFVAGETAKQLENCEAGDLQWLAGSIGRLIPTPNLITGLSINRQGQVYQTAQFYLLINDKLKDEELTVSVQWKLQIKKAEALIQLSQFREAKELIQSFSAGNNQAGDSLQIQQLLGYALSGSNDPADVDLAVQHWRSLTQKLKPGTDAWFEAKYFVANGLKQKGQKEAAHRLLAYLKLTQAEAWNNNQFTKPLNQLLESVE